MDLIGQYRFFGTQVVIYDGMPFGTSYQTEQIVVSYFYVLISYVSDLFPKVYIYRDC